VKDKLLKEVSQRLSALINERAGGKWTIFANSVGIPHGTMKAWLEGKSLPGGEHLAKLVQAGVSADWLLTGNVSGVNQADSFTGLSKEERRLLKDALGILRAEGSAGEFGKMLKQAIETCKVGVEALGGKKS